MERVVELLFRSFVAVDDAASRTLRSGDTPRGLLPALEAGEDRPDDEHHDAAPGCRVCK